MENAVQYTDLYMYRPLFRINKNEWKTPLDGKQDHVGEGKTPS